MSNSTLDLANIFADAAEKAGPAIVTVDARHRMPATGLAFAPDLILTANHVVERDDDLRVFLADNTQVAASLAGREPGADLAVLKLDQALATPPQIASQARVGQLALALGRPAPGSLEASLGMISAISGPARTPFGLLERFYRIEATPYPGFSGGPLVDAEGKVLGLNTSGFGPGMFVSLPVTMAWKIADELAKHGSVKRGYLGIRSQVVELPAAGQTALQREQATGLLIVGLEAETPATKANLLVGDILVGVAGQAVADHDELFAALTGEIVGKSAPVEVLRGGQPLVVDVTIATRPSEHEDEHHHHHHRPQNGHGHRHQR